MGKKALDEEDIDLEELLAEIELEEEIDETLNEAEEAGESEEEEAGEEEEEEGEPMKLEDMTDEDLKAMIEDVIADLRSELNEINLLNAKLLYTNKIFKAKTLNEEQKVKVLSSFDKATTVKEVKLVYSTLNEGLKVKNTPIRENLGRASKATNTPVVNTKQPIVESNAVFDRMRKLAGLI